MKIIIHLFDENSFSPIGALTESHGEKCTVTAGYGTVRGSGVYAFILDGALDIKALERIKKIYALAETTGRPVVGVYNSGGLALNEGFEALSEYGSVVKAAARLSGVVPQVAVICGACIGITAAMAQLADAVIAVKDSDYYIAPPSNVTLDTMAQQGTVDFLADSENEAAALAADLLSLLPENNLAPLPVFTFEESKAEPASDVLSLMCDGVYHIAWKAAYANEVNTVLSTVQGKTTGFIVFDGGEVTPAAADKAAGFLRLCDAYHIPVVTVADSRGLVHGDDAAMLRNGTALISAYAAATCPKISLITDIAAAGAYVILAGKGANADITLAWERAKASPMEIPSAVAFFWNDRLANGENRALLEQEYGTTLGAAVTAAKSGAIDEMISPQQTRDRIAFYLELLQTKREPSLPRKHAVK